MDMGPICVGFETSAAFDLSNDVGCLRTFNNESALESIDCFCVPSGINEFCSRILFGITTLRLGTLRIVVVVVVEVVAIVLVAAVLAVDLLPVGFSISMVVEAGVSAANAAIVADVTVAVGTFMDGVLLGTELPDDFVLMSRSRRNSTMRL